MNIDNVLFQIEFVAEDAVTYGTDAWLPAVPELGNACPHQIFGFCKGRRNVLSVRLFTRALKIPGYLTLSSNQIL